MTEAVQVALIVATAPTLLAVVNWRIALKTAASASAVEKNVEAQGKVQAEQGVVQGEIHVAVNSNMAAATEKIEEGNHALAKAVEEISALKQSAVAAVADASTKAIADLRAELVARDARNGYDHPRPRRRRS